MLAGKDATNAFYGLHRHEVLERPQYRRLQVGVLKDEKPVIYARVEGAISDVPYAEPTWLSKGYHSPYYKQVRVLLAFYPTMERLTLDARCVEPPRATGGAPQVRGRGDVS
jgi:hypothetical protein